MEEDPDDEIHPEVSSLTMFQTKISPILTPRKQRAFLF